MLVPVLCLYLFDESGENGRALLFAVMGRDVLPIRACKKLGFESGICDLQSGSQSDFFVAAIGEHFTDSQLHQKSIKL